MGDIACRYDIFLSFFGQDTRHSFTDHLYRKLNGTGIRTFRDDDEINKGGELTSEFKNAIKGSRASIVVLSKNYATSTWCLEELRLILDQRRECGRFVLPIFYGVDPQQIRKQTGSFDIQVKDEPSTKWTVQNVSRWKIALTEVADLAGHHLSGYETQFLVEIVKTIYNKLDLKKVSLPLNITGMATRCMEINISSWLDQPDLPFLVIYGMDGSGKTTLAKYIYTSHQRSFEHVSFLEDIDNTCNEPNGLCKLQNQLLKDVLGGKEIKIPSVSRGTPMIEEVLQLNQALIVLDDVSRKSQLVALLGTEKINAKSKIIITTTINREDWFELPHWRCQEYEMKLLDGDESSELLCLHAFRCKIPRLGFEALVGDAVHCCEGYPLALQLLGSSLSECKTILSWKSQLKLFSNDLHRGIQGVLERSYKSLPHDMQKELFLHIACFFVGVDIDFVVKILECDYSVEIGIKSLINRSLISVSPIKKITMHRLVQEMGKNIVRRESSLPEDRTRVWLNRDSYSILKNEEGSKTVKGLALDTQTMQKEDFVYKSLEFATNALNNMKKLKLLQLSFVVLYGSYDNFSENLRWLCWLGCPLTIIPVDLFMGNLVAMDLSNSKLEVFEPPTGMKFLQILNLKDSHKLTEIRKLDLTPNLETLILWNCYSLVNVCEKLGDLTALDTLNMIGCESLFSREQINVSSASTLSGVVTEQSTFFFPSSLHRLFLNGCHLECTDSFPLSFSVQQDLQYLNLGNNLFDLLPCYGHLENLRVLDLSFCSKLKCLLSLPSTLAELYVYYCESLERITFDLPRFSLQEIGYEGCTNLNEIEGFIKLIPIAKLDETDLGHMEWLKQYQNLEVCLVGDDELMVGRSRHIQMLYEFAIMNTSLPDIGDPKVKAEYESQSTSLSFDVPTCPINKKLKGINVTCKYELSGDDWVWFCKVSTTNGVVDLMYNPRVFGKPESGEVCVWLSYWPIGNDLKTGDTVHVSIVEIKGFKVHECGVSLVYSDEEILENKMGWEEILGGDLSGFKLSTGGHYLCRRDFHELMEVNRLSPDWFTVLVGDTIDYSDVRGWRKTGQPKQVVNQSFTELKTVRCIIHGPQLEDIYNIAEMSKSSIRDKSATYSDDIVERSKTDAILEGQDYSYSGAKVSSGHDVYINFRGEDTRNTFVDHLYGHLERAGISAFRDDEDINSGEELRPVMDRAIRESKGSIVVLSENFATSAWCLDDLLLILEQRESDHFVLPVFYHVKPSDVRKQRGSFDLQVRPSSSRWTDDNINMWKTALGKVGSISGFVVDGPETKILKSIVDTVSRKLDSEGVRLQQAKK